MFGFFTVWLVGVFAVVALVLSLFIAICFRVVVGTDEVHIVQTKNNTTSYGSNLPAGNVYMNWPHWVPKIGIQRKIMPTTIFCIDLPDYPAFDLGKVPFRVDVKAFFQIEDANVSAKRVKDMQELEEQLIGILSGSVRTILANAEIHSIMESRGEFGDKFTDEVREQLKAWGVATVKNIEFMDIKDAPDSEVIHNIMAKKKSFIEKDSRIEVANNKKEAKEAEIKADQDVDLKQAEADQLVGERNAEKDKQIGIAQEKARQEIKEQAKITAEKNMAVIRVEEEKQAEIDRSVAEIKAEQDKTVKQKNAEAVLIEQTKNAEGSLIQQIKNAEGIKAVGEAQADAKQRMEMAPVTAQIALAKEIGENEGYQQYLLGLEGLKAGIAIGTAKADAMGKGDLKIIANAGDVESGVDKLMDVFSSKGGTSIGSMLESLAQTDIGKQLLDKFIGKSKLPLPKTDVSRSDVIDQI